MEIKDAVAVVTGGASGLGLATTKRLLDAGAQVVVLDIRGKEAVDELGDRATFAQTDVTDEAAVTAALDAAEALGPLRIVINCAGTGNAIKTLGKDGPFPLDAFRKVVEINLIGTFNVIRLGAERIAKTEPIGEERGVIVNTASVAAFDGQIGQAAYSASKGGVVGMTLPIARDLSRDLHPGGDHRARACSTRRCWRACPSRPRSRSASRCRTRAGWASPTSTARWPCTSWRTRCSTARSSASTARSGWPRDDDHDEVHRDVRGRAPRRAGRHAVGRPRGTRCGRGEFGCAGFHHRADAADARGPGQRDRQDAAT